MFKCYFLKQPLHNYEVYKMAGKEGEAASTASQGTQGKLYKKSPGFYTRWLWKADQVQEW